MIAGAPPGAYGIELACSPPEALRAIDRAAEEWGATFERTGGHAGPLDRGADGGAGGAMGIQGGRLSLPVIAGLRRGLLEGPLRAAATDGGLTRVSFAPDGESYRLEAPAVVVLLIAGAGGLLAVAWPLYPHLLLPLAPFGMVLALAGWLLVLSRRRGKSPQDFLARLAALAGAAAAGAETPVEKAPTVSQGKFSPPADGI